MNQNHAALPPQQAASGSEPTPEGQYTGEGVSEALRRPVGTRILAAIDRHKAGVK